MAKPLIRAESLAIGYGGRAILSGIDFVVPERGYVGIIGPNGGGKSTLLKTILGVLQPIQGRLEFALGRGARARVGYVPQRVAFDALIPLSGRQVAEMGLYPQIGVGRRVRKSHRSRVEASLRLAGVADHAGGLFRDMSGGQKQRVLIARALCHEPDLLVLDEPTAGMDMAGEHEVLVLLDELRQQRQLTIVMVSHFVGTLRGRTDQILVCDAHGRGFAAGSPDDMLHEGYVHHLFTGNHPAVGEAP